MFRSLNSDNIKLSMERFFSEQIIKEAEKNQSRKDYEKRAKKIANPFSLDKIPALIDKAILKGLEPADLKKITKEDVIRIDAELEQKARNLAEKAGADSDEQKYLEKMQNSDLVLSKASFRNPGWHIDIIKGKINGQDVRVENAYFFVYNEPRERNEYKGTLNGEKLPEDDAKRIFAEYGPIALDRTTAISDFIREKSDAE